MTLIDRILDLAMMPAGELPAPALAMARFSLFDWLVCGRAGIDEPLAGKLRQLADEEGGRGTASVFGGAPAPARMAALVNGATSHALDYDDTHFGHIGHTSVGIYPAALAAGETVGASARAVVEAFLVGAEASVRIGMALGSVHYNRGFHQTATAGAFGAAIAAGRLFGLTRDQMRVAIGLCATRASGLKSQFGTMGKPYNAGIAAANGVECARLAALGFTSADDGLMNTQGFIPTHSDKPDPDAAWQSPPPETFLFEDIKYKLHACCHGTHAMIEALRTVRGQDGVGIDDVEAMVLHTNPRWLSVCDIKAPRTGLEVKFSYNWLAGMVLEDRDTARDDTYTDALATDAGLAAFAPRITVDGDPALSDMQAKGLLRLKDGRSIAFSHDLARRLGEAELSAGLTAKAKALLGEEGERLRQAVEKLDRLTAADLGTLVGARA
ncbi:MmgE/PrpD family protein [Stappia indica]|uniref:MmgE/PrpD family protein n=1 Tax=Stappia indica TaxID=538381 RepID=UPI0008354157|nr:MmgE/PrpD family protein [Stappia indica]MCC4245052.1 MmgE/PrpD family protein [Stappia indica]